MYIYKEDDIDNLSEYSVVDLYEIKFRIQSEIDQRIEVKRGILKKSIFDPRLKRVIPSRIRNAVRNTLGDITVQELMMLSSKTLLSFEGVGKTTLDSLIKNLVFRLKVPRKSIESLLK